MTPEFAARIDSLTFIVPPPCQGQVVEVAYAADAEGIVRRRHDRSDRTTSFATTRWPASAISFEPQTAEPEIDADDWLSVDEAIA